MTKKHTAADKDAMLRGVFAEIKRHAGRFNRSTWESEMVDLWNEARMPEARPTTDTLLREFVERCEYHARQTNTPSPWERAMYTLAKDLVRAGVVVTR